MLPTGAQPVVRAAVEGPRERERIRTLVVSDHDDLAALLAERIVDTIRRGVAANGDRKSTRLNSSHSQISYAVFCLKKKKKQHTSQQTRHQQRRRQSPMMLVHASYDCCHL